jgi:probable F420-dependent oxidoreductase
MRIGAILPQTEIGRDPGAIRAYAEGVEELGFAHLLVYDHVLGAGTANRPDWKGPYTSESPFHEPFVLFGYLAAITRQIELVTGVIILPQRQTALVAKQAAEIDILSGERLRLGIGVGWNAVEYEGLNENFHNRGARCDEQIAVLRALWGSGEVSFAGRWHTITEAGINPLPKRSIPIWVGGHSEAALRRAGGLGDGWFPQMGPTEEAQGMVERLQRYAAAAGRAADAVGIEARLSLNRVPMDQWQAYAEAWRTIGATHLSINTMSMGYQTVDEHLAALEEAFKGIGYRG